jgi:hypothetical protein
VSGEAEVGESSVLWGSSVGGVVLAVLVAEKSM